VRRNAIGFSRQQPATKNQQPLDSLRNVPYRICGVNERKASPRKAGRNVQTDASKGRRIMRTLISTFAGLALMAGVAPHLAAADVQQPQPQRTITVAGFQGRTITVVLPAQPSEATPAGPAYAVAVTAGQGAHVTVTVPGPSVDVVAAGKAPANGAGGQVTLLPTDAGN
jgi:hypothetical protein